MASPADLREQLQSTLGTAFVVERELGGGGMARVFVVARQSAAGCGSSLGFGFGECG